MKILTVISTSTKNADTLSSHIKKILLGALMMCCATLSYASNEPAQQLKKIGQGNMSWLFFDLYQASLYSKTGDYAVGDYPQALKIIYQRNIYSADLVNVTEKEWQKLGFTSGEYQQWLPVLSALWPDIKEDDVLLFLVDVDGYGAFYHNNQLLGRVDNSAFSKAFLSIWLSTNTSEPALRRKLIGE